MQEAVGKGGCEYEPLVGQVPKDGAEPDDIGGDVVRKAAGETGRHWSQPAVARLPDTSASLRSDTVCTALPAVGAASHELE